MNDEWDGFSPWSKRDSRTETLPVNQDELQGVPKSVPERKQLVLGLIASE